MKVSKTYSRAVKRFLRGADWLTEADAPAVTTLVLLGRQLDEGGFHAPTIQQFGLCYRALLKRAPDQGGAAEDPLEALLEGGSRR